MRLHSLPRFVTTAATALVLLGGVMAQSPAAHADDWCWNDPVVSINGQLVSINVGVKATPDVILANTRKATIVITVPVGVSTALVRQDVGLFPEHVVFQTDINTAWAPGTPVPVSVQSLFNAAPQYLELTTDMRLTLPKGTVLDAPSTTHKPVTQVVKL